MPSARIGSDSFFSSLGRIFSSPFIFGLLLALAVSSRVFYPEPVQLIFFVAFFLYGWLFPSFRKSIVHWLGYFFSRIEGKILLLLCLSVTVTTLLVKSDGHLLWLNWFLLLLGALACCGCVALLSQPQEVLRRIFRLVIICFTISMLLLLMIIATSYLARPFFDSTYLRALHSFQGSHGYYLYSQSGMVVLFFPLLFGSFSRGGVGLSSNRYSRNFWRLCISLGLFFFLLCATLTERRIIGLALLVTAVSTVLAIYDSSKKDRRLFVLLLVCTLFIVLFLLFYLYIYAPTYNRESNLCAECNALFLPSWLVDNSRQFSWLETISVWQERPWFGRGVHNDLSSFDHPHSRFLQVLSGLGIIGFSLFVLLLLLLLFGSFFQWHRRHLLSSLSLFFVHSVYWSIGFFELSIWSAWHFWMYICAVTLSLSLDNLKFRQD